jgi:putative ABC transport system permease protein
MQGGAPVAIVNDVFAREFGQPADLVGRQLTEGDTARKIVGVVHGMDYMTDGANSSQIFTLSRSPGWPGSTFVVKVAGHPEDGRAIVRDTIRSVDPQVPVFGVKTMDQRMAENFARPQFYKTAITFFAAFALLLAIIGIYGIVSYTVARRTHEMGVRMALGATPETLRVVLLRQGLLPIVAGAIPGIVLAALSGHLLESLVEGARSVEPTAYTGSVVSIAAIAAAGIRIATRPIARLDITEVLRTD